MADTPKERADALTRALEATKDKGEKLQQEAVLYLMAPPTQTTVDKLWVWLVRGLIAILVADLAGLVGIMALGKSPAVLLTIFTTTLAGLIGIFVPKP